MDGGAIIIVIFVIAIAIAGISFFWRKNQELEDSENDSGDTPQNYAGNETAVQVGSEQVVQIENEPVVQGENEPTKESSVVIVISGVMLFISIVASIVCFIGCGNEHNDTMQIVLGIIGGYVLLQGIILFGVLYGVGHILRNNEEINETTEELKETNKEINEKMDRIIEKL